MGFFDLIPLVGATLGSIAVAFGTLTVGFPVATIVWVACIFLWQRFEDYVIQPLVYGKSLRVNPIVTIVSVLAGASLLGDPRRAARDPDGRRDPDRPARLVGDAKVRHAGERPTRRRAPARAPARLPDRGRLGTGTYVEDGG